MNATITRHDPIGTVRCSLATCDEVIYRDTLDKDPGYILNGVTNQHFCSEAHAQDYDAAIKRLSAAYMEGW